MSLIHFYWARIDEPINKELWDYYLDLLPLNLCQKCKGFKKWRDQHACILGKLLLLKGVIELGYNEKLIDELCYTQFGRPFMNADFDFNISHSGKYVICAMGRNLRLGVDVQLKMNIGLSDFKNTMTKKQWKLIECSEKPIDTFYKFWTIKESVIKAEGKGLANSLLDIHVSQHIVKYNKRKWYLMELQLDENHFCCLATNKENHSVKFIQIDFYNGLNLSSKLI